MAVFNLQTNLKAFQAQMAAVARKQIPFATAQAMTTLAKDVQAAEVATESKVLDRPRPFTQNSIRVIPARKGPNARARVVMMDIAAGYLEPYEFGGLNVLNGKALLKPVEAVKDLDRYGNLPRRTLAKLKARKDVFIGTVKTKAGPVSGVWQRSTDEGARVVVARVGKDGKVKLGGTRRGGQSSGHLKLLIKFEDAHPVKQHLDWFGVASKTVSANFNKRMGAALAKAMATAK